MITLSNISKYWVISTKCLTLLVYTTFDELFVLVCVCAFMNLRGFGNKFLFVLYLILNSPPFLPPHHWIVSESLGINCFQDFPLAFCRKHRLLGKKVLHWLYIIPYPKITLLLDCRPSFDLCYILYLLFLPVFFCFTIEYLI